MSTAVQQHIESKIETLIQTVEQITSGINARRKMRENIGIELRSIKECRVILQRNNKSTKFVDQLYSDKKELLNENEAIIRNLKAYRSEHKLELAAYKQAQSVVIV